MKYIHSLWTPMNNDNYLKDNIYFYLMSALLVKMRNYEIELFCDSKAYKYYSLLPYDKITIVDFDGDGIKREFWTWSKIKAQLLMNVPYVHIDADVFLFNDVIGDVLQSGKYCAVVQSTENEITMGESFIKSYITAINPFEKYDLGIDWNKYNKHAYNCGAVGFGDIDLKNKYCNKSKELLLTLSNDSKFKYDGKIHYSTHFLSEQSLLYYVLNEHNVKPFEIIPYDVNKEHDYIWQSEIPNKVGYCHMWGNSKNRSEVRLFIVNKIKKHFPQYNSLLNYIDNINKMV